MPVAVFFEGEITVEPQLGLDLDGTAVCTAVVRPFPRSERQKAQWGAALEPPTYQIKALDEHADALASLGEGTGVVVIGHVKAEASIDDDGRRRWRHTVIVDSLGQTVRAGLLVA